MQRRETNVGTLERVARVGGGGLLAALSLAVLIGGPSLILATLAIAGIALGLDFVYTGITGYCPLYARLGWTTVRRPHGRA